MTEPTPADPRRPLIPEPAETGDEPQAAAVGEGNPDVPDAEQDTWVTPWVDRQPAPENERAPEQAVEPAPEQAPEPAPWAESETQDEPAPTPAPEAEPAPVAQAEPALETAPAPSAEPVPVPQAAPASDWVAVPAPAPEPEVRPSPVPVVAEPVLPEPEPDPAPTAETAALPGAAIFRDSPTPEATIVEPRSEEAEKLAAERAARKEAREAALASSAPVAVATPDPVVIHTRTNDKFLGSFGLFALRLVVGAIFTVRGIYLLSNLVEAQEQFAQTIIPYPQVAAIVTGIAHLLIALSLVLGLLTRVAGLGIALIAGGALAFVLWGPWNIFLTPVPGQSGAFLGEFELLLAAVGLLFLLIGGGGWSLDRSFRSARAKDKAERQIAA